MKIVISFLIGIFLTDWWIKNYDGKVFDLWVEAYSIGKDDGYAAGRSDTTLEDFTFEQLEAKCMFLYSDHRRKGEK